MIEYGNATLANTKGKYIFWDIDGTLAPFRFRDHIHDPNGSNNGMSLEEIEEGVFFDRQPSKHMQHVIKTCQAKENIVLGHCHAKKEVEDGLHILREAEDHGFRSYHISSFLDWDYQ